MYLIAILDVLGLVGNRVHAQLFVPKQTGLAVGSSTRDSQEYRKCVQANSEDHDVSWCTCTDSVFTHVCFVREALAQTLNMMQ